MVPSWPTTSLGELVDIQTGKLDANQANEEGIYPFFTCAAEPLRINEAAFDCDAILLAGNNANGVFHINRYHGQFNAYQRTYVITVKDASKTDLNYLFYKLKTLVSRLQEFSIGSVTRFLTMRILTPLPIELPSLPEQRAIAAVLGAFDDKIELNRRMNTTLEAMARALFKSWFVDFDPVRAKMEGRESGLPPEIDALFPDALVDSAVGEIPRGWEVGTIANIADVIDCLHSKKPERQDSGKPLLQLWNIRNNGLIDMTDTYFIKEDDYQRWTTRMEASPGDCVITNVGRVGATAQIPDGLKAALGRNMTGIRCNTDYPFPTFLLEALTSDSMRSEIAEKTDTGTILDALNVRSIPRLRLVLPPIGTIRKFEAIARPIRKRLDTTLKYSRTLAALRDTLLPKLMSGEIRLTES